MRVPPWLAFAACTFIWGTTWLAIKVSYAGIDALWGASLRFFLAGGLLVAFLAVRPHPAPVRRVDVAVTFFVGLVLFGLDYGLIYWGEQALESGLTAILFATMPLFVGVFAAALVPGERWTPLRALGLALGLAGLLLVFRDSLHFEPADLIPMLAIVTSAAAAASSSVVMRRWARATNPFFLNGGAMLVGAVALLCASLLRGEQQALPRGPIPWAATLYLSLIGSVLSFLLYFDLLHAWGANRSSLITLLTPVVAVATGTLVGESLSWVQWAGSALVLAGVTVSLRPGPDVRTQRGTPADV